MIAEFERVATFVEPANTVSVWADPDDEVYLATATSGGAILITGNSGDFAEPTYGSVKVLSLHKFIDKVREQVVRYESLRHRCGPAVNESDRKASEHLKSGLIDEHGHGEWRLVTNLAFSTTHRNTVILPSHSQRAGLDFLQTATDLDEAQGT